MPRCDVTGTNELAILHTRWRVEVFEWARLGCAIPKVEARIGQRLGDRSLWAEFVA
jgi:hypothetical protein